MKIVVMCPKSEFNFAQQSRLDAMGSVFFTKNRDEYPLEELIEMSHGCDILAFSPENIGGFELVSERLPKLLATIPRLKGIALETTSFGYVDLDYCKAHSIIVSNVPYYSTESVAEHVLGFLLGAAKRIFISDRKTQKGNYELIMGQELMGKTLGVVGLGHIGRRVAELGKAVGMKVIAWNRNPKEISEVEMVSLGDLIAQADAISINLASNTETELIISKELLTRVKKGVIIVNAADRSLVDEDAMSESLRRGDVDTYVCEAEDLLTSPLSGSENALLFQGFGWFTKEALERNKEIWIDSIEGILKGTPINTVT
jgi:lactate dehydrogenase-like 2-hydroxyacid dehydrogenase